MNYRVECLTPVLVSDGGALSPIDYMVWKDQVNVLDQRKICRLLAKGPRLDSYLNQVKRAEKLDFASWGGFAQNFAGRRIAFEHSSIASQWERQPADACHIPTFTRSHEGSYLPGSALRGALRTALVSARLDEKALDLFRETMESEWSPRRPGDALEQRTLSNEGARGGWDPLKAFAVSDSHVASAGPAATKVYLARVASLAESRDPKTQAARPFTLAWKQSRGGSVEARRVDESTPVFAEMAPPGTVFDGAWTERDYYRKGEIRQVLRLRDVDLRKTLIEAANAYAAYVLAEHRRFAASATLPALDASLAELEARLAEAQAAGNRCLLNIGWGGGLLSKSAWPVSAPGAQETYRRMLAAQAVWARAIRTGMPFPKTRRVVFLQGQPAVLPGWVCLAVS